MHPSPLLGPIVALVAWSIVMLFWMAAERYGIVKGRDIPDGARGDYLERECPGRAHWPAHNYVHLMEQPTIFYAVCFALILMGFDAPINVWLAWAYVGFRVAHSVIQATVNKVTIRFVLFLLSSLCLLGLTTHAALRLLHV